MSRSQMPTAGRIVRRSLVAGGALVAAGATVLAMGTPALAAPGHSSSPHTVHQPHSATAVRIATHFLDATNATREAHGLAPVALSVRMTTLADHHSVKMVRENTLFHNMGLPRVVHNWTTIGENVGEGPSEAMIENAFMHSAPHRANILNPRYTQLGVGIVEDSHGDVWVTEDFRRPEAGTWAYRHAERHIRQIERSES